MAAKPETPDTTITTDPSAQDIADLSTSQVVAAQNAQTQQNAFASLNALFASYGMENIAQAVLGAVQKGYSTDTISLAMQAPSQDPVLKSLHEAYNQRFAGNVARQKMGLPPLDPATYLSVEEGYRQTLQSAGIPKGFYDSQDTMANLIGNNVSPTEFKDRVSAAQKAIDNTDPYYTQALKEMYGLDNGHMLAHILDPNAAAPLVERQAKAAEYGAAAARQGLAMSQTGNYEAYASGVGTGVGAEQGYQAIGEMLPELQTLAQIGGGTYNQQTAEQEVFGGLASAKRAREKLTQEEVNRFTGRSNVASEALGSQTIGQF